MVSELVEELSECYLQGVKHAVLRYALLSPAVRARYVRCKYMPLQKLSPAHEQALAHNKNILDSLQAQEDMHNEVTLA